jgi:hypothetical protein
MPTLEAKQIFKLQRPRRLGSTGVSYCQYTNKNRSASGNLPMTEELEALFDTNETDRVFVLGWVVKGNLHIEHLVEDRPW